MNYCNWFVIYAINPAVKPYPCIVTRFETLVALILRGSYIWTYTTYPIIPELCIEAELIIPLNKLPLIVFDVSDPTKNPAVGF